MRTGKSSTTDSSPNKSRNIFISMPYMYIYIFLDDFHTDDFSQNMCQRWGLAAGMELGDFEIGHKKGRFFFFFFSDKRFYINFIVGLSPTYGSV